MRQWVRRAGSKKPCFSQRVLNMKTLLKWPCKCESERCGSGLYGHMSSLMQRGQKLPFLQVTIKIVEVT